MIWQLNARADVKRLSANKIHVQGPRKGLQVNIPGTSLCVFLVHLGQVSYLELY